MSKTINTALQELADVINNLPVEETASSRPEDKPQLNQAKTRGITDEDISMLWWRCIGTSRIWCAACSRIICATAAN